MKPTDADFEELRARVDALERQIARLSQAPEIPSSSTGEIPPPLPSPDSGIASSPSPLPASSSAKPSAPAPISRPRQSLSDSDFWRWFKSLSATNWIAAVGAVIFLIGAVYGLTVSFRRGWISPELRVAIGLVFGLANGFAASRLLASSRKIPGITLLALGSGTWTFALYYGAREMFLFSNEIGFAGAGLAVLLAGVIATKFRNDWALAVALANGLIAPLLFSGKQGSTPGLLAYLAVLLGSQLALHYLTKTGADWHVSRRIGSTVPWLVALVTISSARKIDVDNTLIALGALAVVSQLLAWLPAHHERPSKPSHASAFGFVGAALCCFSVWQHAKWSHESFAWLLLGFAACSFALTPYAQRRESSPNRAAIMTLLAVGFALQASPLLLAWRWVVLAWGLGALAIALVAKYFHREDASPAPILIAAIVATAASVVWLITRFELSKDESIFFNPVFAGGALAAASWGVLASIPSQAQRVAFPLLQLLAVNVLALEFKRMVPDVKDADSMIHLRLGTILATLTYAAAGVAQWLRSFLYEQIPSRARAFRLAGYAWIAVASGKFFIFDLSRSDLLLRAIAALSLGSILIGASFWADKKRPR